MSTVHAIPPQGEAIDRTVPNDEHAEQMVLGAAMDDARAYTEAADAGLTRADFYRPAHQLLWDVIGLQVTNKQPTHPVAVRAEIAKLGRLREVDGGSYIDTLGLLNVPAASAGYFADLVLEAARLRRADDLAIRIKTAVQQGADPAAVDQIIRDHQQYEHKRTTGSTDGLAGRFVTGGAFILDRPEKVPAIWGEGDQVLWAEGEALIIAGPPGVGKTTVGQQVLLAAIGIRSHALGMAVRPAQRVLYLASDRPQQAARSMARMVGSEHRDLLDKHLVFWPGPPPSDFIKDPGVLLCLAQQADADVVCLDSLKDMAGELASEEGGQAINSAIQRTLVEGIEVLALHHHRKQGGGKEGGKEPTSLDELYGSTWITAGAGSVVSLWGAAGEPIVSLRHLKQPAAECGPWKLRHDHPIGLTEIWHQVDILAMLRTAGSGGLTPLALAVNLYPNPSSKPTASEMEKARRRLDQYVEQGLAVVQKLGSGRTAKSVYFAAFNEAGELPL